MVCVLISQPKIVPLMPLHRVAKSTFFFTAGWYYQLSQNYGGMFASWEERRGKRTFQSPATRKMEVQHAQQICGEWTRRGSYLCNLHVFNECNFSRVPLTSALRHTGRCRWEKWPSIGVCSKWHRLQVSRFCHEERDRNTCNCWRTKANTERLHQCTPPLWSHKRDNRHRDRRIPWWVFQGKQTDIEWGWQEKTYVNSKLYTFFLQFHSMYIWWKLNILRFFSGGGIMWRWLCSKSLRPSRGFQRGEALGQQSRCAYIQSLFWCSCSKSDESDRNLPKIILQCHPKGWYGRDRLQVCFTSEITLQVCCSLFRLS